MLDDWDKQVKELSKSGQKWERNVDKFLAEFSHYLRKHKLVSHDGKEYNKQLQDIMKIVTYLDPSKKETSEMIINDRRSVESAIPFKIQLLKMLINYGEEDLQDELDALKGRAGDELIDEEIAKQKRLAKRLSKLVEAEVEAKRQLYTESVGRFKEYEIYILSQAEIGTLTQEEADKKLEEARRHAAQELKKISKKS